MGKQGKEIGRMDYKLAIIIDGLLCVVNGLLAIASPTHISVFCAGFTFGVFALLCACAMRMR